MVTGRQVRIKEKYLVELYDKGISVNEALSSYLNALKENKATENISLEDMRVMMVSVLSEYMQR